MSKYVKPLIETADGLKIDDTLIPNTIARTDDIREEISQLSPETILHETDVENDLKSTATNKPLSAAQGVVLNDKINNLQIDLNNINTELTALSNCTAIASKVYITDWTLGRLQTTGIASSTYRAYSNRLPADNETLYYFDDTKYKLCFCGYRNPDDANISGTSSWFETSPALNPLSPNTYSKVSLQLQALDTSMKINVVTDIEVYFLQSADSVTSVLVDKVLTNETNIDKILSNSTIDKIVYVSTSGSDDNDGSKESPYRTIQKAIDKDAEIIKVFSGEYSPVTIANKDHPIVIMLADNPTYSASPEEQDLPKIKITNADSYTGISASNCTELYMYDIWCDNVARSPFYLKDCGYVECFRCYASNNSVDNFGGFRIVNCNGVFRDCKAWNITLDGFNIHGYGNTEFINCMAFDCGDDGISHHDSCTGLVIGGEFYNNGKGGISSPYGGAKIDIYNAYSHDNTKYGLYADSDSTHPSIYARVSNCVFKNNGTSDIYVADGTVISWHNVYDTINVRETATYTNYTDAINNISIQANWNQNDETAPDYIKNRTHWEKNTTLLEETTFQTDLDNSPVSFTVPTVPEVGDTCVITYNGTEYICNAIPFAGNIGLGNLIDVSTEPFAIVIEPSGAASIVCKDDDGSTTFTLAITITSVNKIPTKFIPSLEEMKAECILPETTGEIDPELEGIMLPGVQLIAGETYLVKYNGVNYSCKCVNVEGMAALGNIELIMGTGSNGDPFVVACQSLDGEMMCAVIPVDGATSVTISISQVKDPSANAAPFYFEAAHGAQEAENIYQMVSTVPFSAIEEAYLNKRSMYLIIRDEPGAEEGYKYATDFNTEGVIVPLSRKIDQHQFLGHDCTAYLFETVIYRNNGKVTKLEIEMLALPESELTFGFITYRTLTTRVFVADYGSTRFDEINGYLNMYVGEILNERAAIFCHYSMENNSNHSVFSLVSSDADKITFIGETSEGKRKIVCNSDNSWTISAVESEQFATEEYVDSKLQIQSADEVVTLQKDILFYEAEIPKKGLDIEGTFSDIPYGWVAYLTILGNGNDSVSSTILESTSINGFTLSEFDVSESFTMAIFKHRGKTKLQWYLFKPLPSAEEASF